jgi:hypothetical protein
MAQNCESFAQPAGIVAIITLCFVKVVPTLVFRTFDTAFCQLVAHLFGIASQVRQHCVSAKFAQASPNPQDSVASGPPNTARISPKPRNCDHKKPMFLDAKSLI